MQIELVNSGADVGVTDDSDSTTQAVLVDTDLAACGGSFVHKMSGVLNPCCSEGSVDCESSAFEPQQVNPVADAVTAQSTGTADTATTAASPAAAAAPQGSGAAGIAISSAALAGAALALLAMLV